MYIMSVWICKNMATEISLIYTECKYGGPLGRPGSSCAKARLVRPPEFCFDCAS